MSRDYGLATFTTTWDGVPNAVLLVMFTCYPGLMFLASPWLETYRFSNWPFADFDQFRVNVHFANFGQVKIVPVRSVGMGSVRCWCKPSHFVNCIVLSFIGQAFQWIFCAQAINRPCKEVFFTYSADDLLPARGFLGGLYNFCNFAIIFSLM